MKFSKKEKDLYFSIGLGMLLIVTAIIFNYVFADKLTTQAMIPWVIVAYFIATKLIFTRIVCLNCKRLSGDNLPSFIAFIPYVQNVLIAGTDRIWLSVAYLLSLTLAVATPVLLTSRGILNAVGILNVDAYVQWVIYATVGFGALWRILHGYIQLDAFNSLYDFTSDHLGGATSGNGNALFEFLMRLYGWIIRIGFFIPMVSLLSVLSLMFESNRAVNIKNRHLRGKARA